MEAWLDFVIPAIATALVIRIDSLVIGPYFAVSELISGMGGMELQFWYRDSTIRLALLRRFLYPVLLGFVLHALGRDLGSVMSAGALTWGLLIWPAVFHGLPHGVSRRDWQVPAMYLSLLIGYAALARVGAYAAEVVKAAGDGSYANYVSENVGAAVVHILLGLGSTAFFKGSVASLAKKRDKRELMGNEYSFDGPHAQLDQAPQKGQSEPPDGDVEPS